MPCGIMHQHGKIIKEKMNHFEAVAAKTQF